MTDFIDQTQLYPLKFVPILKERLWGGNQLQRKLKRDIKAGETPVGESWELCDRSDSQSVVANGSLAGATLNEVLRHYGKALVGRRWNGGERFPLMVKLIDAGQKLSLQVHPDSKSAQKIGNGAEPKTEMWYIIDTDPGAFVPAGLNHRATKIRLQESLESADMEMFFQRYESRPGDAFFVTAGTPHSIGGGNLILEIQQNSDTTYRLSDWGRVDVRGCKRDLHIKEGLESIDFTNRVNPRIAGVSGVTDRNRKFDVVKNCPFFQVSDLRLTGVWNDDTASNSFHLISAVNGPVSVGKLGSDNSNVEVAAGETALLPACYGAYTIEVLNPGETTVIKCTL
jgi:mannose-6-phosphate isomerase